MDWYNEQIKRVLADRELRKGAPGMLKNADYDDSNENNIPLMTNQELTEMLKCFARQSDRTMNLIKELLVSAMTSGRTGKGSFVGHVRKLQCVYCYKMMDRSLSENSTEKDIQFWKVCRICNVWMHCEDCI